MRFFLGRQYRIQKNPTRTFNQRGKLHKTDSMLNDAVVQFAVSTSHLGDYDDTVPFWIESNNLVKPNTFRGKLSRWARSKRKSYGIPK